MATSKPEIIKRLIEAGSDVNSKNERVGNTPLMEAVFDDNIDFVRYLLEKGADVNVQNKYEVTPYMQAKRIRYSKNKYRYNDKEYKTPMMELLLEYGANTEDPRDARKRREGNSSVLPVVGGKKKRRTRRRKSRGRK